MNPSNHVGRWIAVGASVLAFTAAGTVAATTEPPDTSAGADTTMAGDTTMGSEPTGAGPSDCPAVTAAADTTDAAATTDGAAGTDAGATTEATATETTGAMDTTMDTTMATTGDTGVVDVSAPPMAIDGPAVQIVETDEYGPILADGACFTLYGFTNDVDGEPTCEEDCAVNWPPAFVADAVPPLADELDPALFSVVEHAEGPMLKVGDWPLYYFAGDMAPGDINGQGVGGVWWVVAPDGTLIETVEGGETTEAAGGTDAAGTDAAATTAATETTEG